MGKLKNILVLDGTFKVGDRANLPFYGECQIRKINGNKITIVTVEVDNNNNTYEFECKKELVTTMKLIIEEKHYIQDYLDKKRGITK